MARWWTWLVPGDAVGGGRPEWRPALRVPNQRAGRYRAESADLRRRGRVYG